MNYQYELPTSTYIYYICMNNSYQKFILFSMNLRREKNIKLGAVLLSYFLLHTSNSYFFFKKYELKITLREKGIFFLTQGHLIITKAKKPTRQWVNGQFCLWTTTEKKSKHAKVSGYRSVVTKGLHATLIRFTKGSVPFLM